MTRGSHRMDLPASGAGWIDRTCSVEVWEYWESRFGQGFSATLRNEIAVALSDFRAYSKTHYEQTGSDEFTRLDVKQIKRELKATIRSGSYRSPKIQRLVETYSPRGQGATVAQKTTLFLEEFKTCPNDFLIERPDPKPLYTKVFYDLFHRHGMNVSFGSAGTLYGKEGMSAEARVKDAPETPFVEFTRRCIWEEQNPSAAFCARVRKLIQRCPVCSKL